jgi:hypothetical protein
MDARFKQFLECFGITKEQAEAEGVGSGCFTDEFMNDTYRTYAEIIVLKMHNSALEPMMYPNGGRLLACLPGKDGTCHLIVFYENGRKSMLVSCRNDVLRLEVIYADDVMNNKRRVTVYDEHGNLRKISYYHYDYVVKAMAFVDGDVHNISPWIEYKAWMEHRLSGAERKAKFKVLDELRRTKVIVA